MKARKVQALVLLVFAVAMAIVAVILAKRDLGITIVFAILSVCAAGASHATWPRDMRGRYL